MSEIVEKPLRILQISASDQGGGAQVWALSLHRLYRELGHDSILLVGHQRNPPEPGVIELDNSARSQGWNRARCWIEKHLGWQDICYPGSHRIPEQIRRPVDVIHIHNLHGYFFDINALPRLSRWAPTIVMMHDLWLQTGHCCHTFGCERWQTGCGHCPDLLSPRPIRRDGTRFNWKRKRNALHDSPVWLTSVSRWVLDQAAQSFLAEKPMRLIHVGMDPEIFYPGDREAARAKLDLPPKVPLILFSAAAAFENPFKDGRMVLNAFEKVLEQIPEARLLALGADSIPDEFSALRDAVILRPFDTDRRRVGDIVRAVNVIAHGAKIETAGMVLIEGMACATPVVASRVGGTPEYVEDQKTGILVESGDADAMAKHLHAILTNPTLAKELGEAGVARAHANFSIPKQAEKYLAWYRKLASLTTDKQ